MKLKVILLLSILILNNLALSRADDDQSDDKDGEDSGSTEATGSTEANDSDDKEKDDDKESSKGDSKQESSEESSSESSKMPQEVKGSPEDRSKSECPKNCHKTSVKKYQSQCIFNEFKIAEKTKTVAECTEKCKTFSVCGASAFVGPRSVTTHDLTTLYEKVINSDNWVQTKERGDSLKFYQQYDDPELYNHLNAEFDEYDNPETYSKINNSALKISEEFGFCYIFQDKVIDNGKIDCTPSHLTFTYDEIECTEDQKCLDNQPRKKCSRGKCGKTCKEYNTVHIPNACMGRYFFGHLEADSLTSCLEFCLSVKECKSIDFGNMGSCLINYVNRNDTQLTMGCDLKNNEIWDYYEIIDDSECLSEKPKPSPNEDVCVNEPGICRNGGNCQSVPLAPPEQSFDYECHCPCNWCGKHCDKLNMKTFRNGCLNASALVWSVAESALDCIDMCLDEIKCKSVSYSATSGTCALHWADHTEDPIVASPDCPSYRTDIVEKEWTLYEILCDQKTCHSSVEVIESKELKGCASNPCLNGGECADIYQRGKVVGYHCLCKCGYCGDRCESHNYELTDNACIWKYHISDNPHDYYRKSVSLNTCLDVCALKFPLCRSVDFSAKGECLLNRRDSGGAPVTEGCNNFMRQRWSLYELSCVCNNKPILH